MTKQPTRVQLLAPTPADVEAVITGLKTGISAFARWLELEDAIEEERLANACGGARRRTLPMPAIGSSVRALLRPKPPQRPGSMRASLSTRKLAMRSIKTCRGT
jgi:hypothetical protein